MYLGGKTNRVKGGEQQQQFSEEMSRLPAWLDIQVPESQPEGEYGREGQAVHVSSTSFICNGKTPIKLRIRPRIRGLKLESVSWKKYMVSRIRT